MNSNTEIIRMQNIYKYFPGVKALEDVGLVVNSGEVHALVGENGAGKSTLIKILMGVLQKDKGEVFIEGNRVNIKNPTQAKQYGLSAVYQDIMLAPHLSIGENFFLGKLPKTKTGLVNWRKINKDAKNTLLELDIDINPKILVKDLTVAQRKMISIAKIIHGDAKLVVFDEPTASLSNEETEELFKIIEKLKKNNIGIIYISHRIEEVFRLSSRVTVLKDGKLVKTMDTSDTNQDKLIALMVGRNVEELYSIERHKSREVLLEVRGLTKKGIFNNINFEVNKGEIVGIFGLVGSGITDIVKCIFGAESFDSGDIFINGDKVSIKSPHDAINYGIGFLPDDRRQEGLCINLSIKLNVNLASYRDITKFGIINSKKEEETTIKYIDDLNIKTPSTMQKILNLSGGNQQKVVISKWLRKKSNIFIFNEPTVGVDIGAKAEIYKLLEKIVKNGNSIILISSYLPEVMGVSDKLLVISEGNLTGVLPREEYYMQTNDDEEKIMKLASGIVN
jgi:ribose transport system ATP-binding protein